jgi:hypothetical protein
VLDRIDDQRGAPDSGLARDERDDACSRYGHEDRSPHEPSTGGRRRPRPATPVGPRAHEGQPITTAATTQPAISRTRSRGRRRRSTAPVGTSAMRASIARQRPGDGGRAGTAAERRAVTSRASPAPPHNPGAGRFAPGGACRRSAPPRRGPPARKPEPSR